VLVPVHVSATSHSFAAARHVTPALPAAWTHAGAPTVPLHRSVVHTLPSSVHAVPEAFTVSAGHVPLPPVHVSARSHSFAAARHVVPVVTKLQLAVQQELLEPFATPVSHCSPLSTEPLPHFDL
jgi:hypothetical protein